MADQRTVQSISVSYDSCESLKSSISSRGTLAAAGSTPSAAVISRNRHKRISILKKLREKLATAEVAAVPTSSSSASSSSSSSSSASSASASASSSLQQQYAVSSDPSPTANSTAIDTGGQPTIIRVGTVSSCTSTVRSWRVVDEFLRNRFDFSMSPSRQSTLSNRSLASGKTLIYDDKSSLQIDNSDFCTVIKVEEDCPPPPPSLEHVNVIIERNNDDSDSSSLIDSSSSPSTVTAVQQGVDENCTITTGICHSTDSNGCNENAGNENNGKPVTASGVAPANRRQHRQSPVVAQQEASTTANRTSVCGAAYFCPLPSIVLPPNMSAAAAAGAVGPPPPPPLFGPSQLSAGGGGASPIELTNWRIRPDFDAEPSSNRGAADSQTHRPDNGLPNLNMLTPDDLPRLYPGWNMPPIHPPFRFDEEFEEEPKGCCGTGRFSHSMMIRVFIAVISLIGLSCVVVGIVLGALTVSGSTRLTLCLLMIGVGVVLIIVSGIAWRLTSLDPAITPSCWTILGLRAQRPQSVFPERRSRTAYYRVRNVRRPMAPFCGMLQSEFAWRPPPPTYQATMQELRLQTFLCARNHREPGGPSGSPPPTYRSDNETENARPSLNDFIQRISRPPSYRSHDNVQSACIEERPLLPCDMQVIDNGNAGVTGQQRVDQTTDNSQTTDTVGMVEGSAIAAPENVHVDDRVKLVAHDQLQRSLSNENLPSASNQIHANHQISGRLGNTNSTPSLLDRARAGGKLETISVIDCSAADPVVTMATDIAAQQRNPAAMAAVRFASPQVTRPPPHRRYRSGFVTPNATANAAAAVAAGYYRQPPPPPQLIHRGPLPPPNNFAMRYSMPFFAHHHGTPPLMPIRVQPAAAAAQIRWRMVPSQTAAANLQTIPRLPTVAGNVREEQMQSANAGATFSDSANRDPSYV